MSEMVNIYEAKTHLSRLIERATAGEEIVIARAGKPLVRLTPVAAAPRRVSGQLAGLIIPDELFRPLTDEELVDWE